MQKLKSYQASGSFSTAHGFFLLFISSRFLLVVRQDVYLLKTQKNSACHKREAHQSTLCKLFSVYLQNITVHAEISSLIVGLRLNLQRKNALNLIVQTISIFYGPQSPMYTYLSSLTIDFHLFTTRPINEDCLAPGF